MKRYLNFIVIISGFALLISCSQNINAKLIVGKWNREKISSVVKNPVSKKESAAAKTGQSDVAVKTQEKAQNDTLALDPLRSFHTSSNADEVRKLKNKIRKSMEFRADKTATFTISKSEMNGKWKMNSKGTSIIFTNAANNERIKISLVKVDSVRLIIAEEITGGKALIDYIKQ
jgi:hypothetical protein